MAEMTVEEVWDRTSEVIRDHGKCALGGELTAAPWSVFHGALSCLVKQVRLPPISAHFLPPSLTKSLDH